MLDEERRLSVEQLAKQGNMAPADSARALAELLDAGLILPPNGEDPVEEAANLRALAASYPQPGPRTRR